MDSRDRIRRNRAYQRLFDRSFKRLKRRGLSDHEAGRIAREVAEESLERVAVPDFRSEHEFAEAVERICMGLGDGKSYYVLIGEMPYLATSRIDRVVAAAGRTDPPVERSIVRAAKEAARLERLSGAAALLFMGVVLGILGLWSAIAAGIAMAVIVEVFVQTMMPQTIRRSAARMHLPMAVNLAAAAALVYFGYRWIDGTRPHAGLIVLAGRRSTGQ